MKTTASNSNLDAEALVIGTGFGGMGAAIQLKRMGFKKLPD